MEHERIRQFVRQDVSMPSILRIAEEDANQIHFSGALEASLNEVALQVNVVDVGHGGVGVESSVFLPRNARGILEIFKEKSSGASVQSLKNRDQVILREAITIKRCSQISRLPTYNLGLAFCSVSPELTAQLDRLMSPSSAETDVDETVADPTSRRTDGGVNGA